MTLLPENLILLHNEEEQLRAKSLAAIQEDKELLLHLNIVEAAMDVCNTLRQFKTDDENLKVIQLFGMRMFNAFAASIKLIMSGYYQKGGLVMRDILETVFLADYFRTDPQEITRWRFADKKEQMQSFRPIHIREALDKRDGYTSKKRAELYEMFSELAGHPNMKSAMMLRPKGTDDAFVGPFFDVTSLKASLGEMGKLAFQVGEIIDAFFPVDWCEEYPSRQAFLYTKEQWLKRYYPSIAIKLKKGA
jgi:hypothetical protein